MAGMPDNTASMTAATQINPHQSVTVMGTGYRTYSIKSLASLSEALQMPGVRSGGPLEVMLVFPMLSTLAYSVTSMSNWRHGFTVGIIFRNYCGISVITGTLVIEPQVTVAVSSGSRCKNCGEKGDGMVRLTFAPPRVAEAFIVIAEMPAELGS